VTAIGEVSAGSGVRVLDAAGAEVVIDRTGWDHF
jgi:thiamine monophosphate kinase